MEIWLNSNHPTPYPVRVRWVKKIAADRGSPPWHVKIGDVGECYWADGKITILLSARLCRTYMVATETLHHEWAHAVVMKNARVHNHPANTKEEHPDEWALAYGKIYREMLLVDISPEKLDQLRHKFVQIKTSQRRDLLYRVLSLGGMLLLICLVYLFLNAATRGYYTWMLRIAAVVFAMIGVWLVAMLRPQWGDLSAVIGAGFGIGAGWGSLAAIRNRAPVMLIA